MLSKGEQLLREISQIYFIDSIPQFNTRPSWLKGLELDVYYPDKKAAFEFQGDQHFSLNRFNDNFFEKLKKQVFYDKYKKTLCEERGITLFQIGTFELVPKRFQTMMERQGFSDNLFIERLGNKYDTFWRRVKDINNEYRKYNNGRKCMSMKNPAAREGYLMGMLKMNPKKNKFMRPSFVTKD